MEDRAAPQRDAAARSSGPRSLGIIAGGGPMPAKVATAARAAGRQVFIIGVEGFADRAVLAPWPHEILRIGAAGRIVAAFRENGCQDLVMIGPVRRPSLLDLRPDADGVRILARIGRAIFLGDDGLLAAIMRVFAEEGFRVIGAHEIMQGVIAPLGVLSRLVPDASALADIARGVEVTRVLGAADVGQGCVIQQGLVLAVEAIEGTDAMLSRAATLRRDGIGGVLVKLVKPGQDRRADLPTIGPETVRHAAAAGLRGLAFEAGATILAEREACVAAADAAGLFLLGLDPVGLDPRIASEALETQT
jgi:UDP-2,3-diacylglucosamine hydrolase